MNRHLEGGSSDYSKMTKAELIEALTLAYSDISPLTDLIPADRITELEAEVAKLKSELEKLNAHD